MSCISMRLLPPPHKAWKSFTSKLQVKLGKFNKSKPLKKKPSKKKRRSLPKSNNSSFRFHSNKAAAAPPVYIDALFPEPPATTAAVSAPKAKHSSTETSKKGGRVTRDHVQSPEDGMWESIGFASPQMRGIDERAEKFIFSFRAEMELEEMMARRL